MKSGDNKICHGNNTLEPHYRNSGHKWQFSPRDCCNASLGKVLGNSVGKSGKKTPGLLLSTVLITFELDTRTHPGGLPFKEWSGTLSFHPLPFPLEGTAPFFNTSPYFPLGNLLHPTASLLWQPPEVL